MKASECMSRDVRFVEQRSSIRSAATLMGEAGIGVIPVASKERLIGIVTDRDIVVRGIAANKGPDCPVEEVMTPEVKYCFDEDPIEEVVRKMIELQVRRIPVVDHDRILVGVISLSDIARVCESDLTGSAVIGITRPGGVHCQTPEELTA